MSVILEFTIDNTAFQLGQVLAGATDSMHLELERIVPTGNMVMPFVWATGANHEAFEKEVRSQPAVKELLALDKLGKSGLYRIEWEKEPTDLTEGLAEADAIVLDARGRDTWVFRIRFPNHDKLSQFYNFCTDHGIGIHIIRTFTLTERTESVKQFDLSKEQREALILGLREGYFETPSQVELGELAGKLDISQQAVSNRIRRGTKRVLTEALLSSPDVDQ